jgi:hypothetical protein
VSIFFTSVSRVPLNSIGFIEISRTARKLPQLLTCSFSRRKKFQINRRIISSGDVMHLERKMANMSTGEYPNKGVNLRQLIPQVVSGKKGTPSNHPLATAMASYPHSHPPPSGHKPNKHWIVDFCQKKTFPSLSDEIFFDSVEYSRQNLYTKVYGRYRQGAASLGPHLHLCL